VKTRLSPAIVGMFVLGAVLLLVLGFVSFGGTNIFSKPTRFVVYFDESVSGLDPGGAVKIHGVRIGRVAAINVRYDSATRSASVQTICEIDRNVLTDADGKTIELTDVDELRNLVERGLRARLNLQGITGLLFVELNFEDPREYPAPARHHPSPHPVVPAIRSPISEVQNSIVEIVADLKAARISVLAQDLRTLVGTANQKLDDLNVKQIGARVSAAAEAVEKFTNSDDMRRTFANLNEAVTELRALANSLNAQVGPVGDDFRKTLADAQGAIKSIDEAAQTTRRFVSAQSYVGEDFARTLRQISEAADAIQRLAELLERNPNAVLVGTKPKP
jgi:paraquat-inducible protein B